MPPLLCSKDKKKKKGTARAMPLAPTKLVMELWPPRHQLPPSGQFPPDIINSASQVCLPAEHSIRHAGDVSSSLPPHRGLASMLGELIFKYRTVDAREPGWSSSLCNAENLTGKKQAWMSILHQLTIFNIFTKCFHGQSDAHSS